jgi:hypothetical protein
MGRMPMGHLSAMGAEVCNQHFFIRGPSVLDLKTRMGNGPGPENRSAFIESVGDQVHQNRVTHVN